MADSSEASLSTQSEVVDEEENPLNIPKACWSDYAKGWLSLYKNPIELHLINEPRTDAVFIAVHKLSCAVEAVQETYNQAIERLDRLLRERNAREEELKTLREKMIEAKDTVKQKVKDLQGLQANAARAINQHPGPQQALEKEKWEWQIAVGIRADVLFRAGLEYRDTVSRFKQCQSLQKLAENDIAFLDQTREALKKELDIKEPQWSFCFQQLSNALDGMRQQWDMAISDWGPNAKVGECLETLENYLNRVDA